MLPKDIFELNPRQTIAEQVYERLRAAIVNGHLKPGDRLLEEELAERMGVSRTPIREAFRRLELERLITTKSHRGAVVTKFSFEEASEFYEARAVLEGYVSRLAAQKASEYHRNEMRRLMEDYRAATASGDAEKIMERNDQFHFAICEASQNRYLKEVLMTLIAYVNLSRISVPVWRFNATLDEHEAILAAILDRDPVEAEKRAVLHVNNARESAFIQYTEATRSGRPAQAEDEH